MTTDVTADQETKPDSQIEQDLAGAPSFIERQFPVAKVSAESYKERKANHAQTLTGLGKWWGRKPLGLVRATILGLLLPVTDDPKRDQDIFLKLMTMDDDGMRRRKKDKIDRKLLYQFATAVEREQFFQDVDATWKTDAEIAWVEMDQAKRKSLFTAEPTFAEANLIQGPRKKDTNERKREMRRIYREAKEVFDSRVFDRLAYSEKLSHCHRPEEIDGPDEHAWAEINEHLETNAQSLPELIEQLGFRRFGKRPRVGDSFCGAGSIPFEAARIGCDVYASDLSPVAALLTWAALNIVGGGPEIAERVEQTQREVFDAVDRQVAEWGIEHNDQGWRADAYLYCVEVDCPECGWRIPLAPSWVIGEKTRTIAELVPDEGSKRYEIKIRQSVKPAEVEAAKEAGTVGNSRLQCPNCKQDTPIDTIR